MKSENRVRGKNEDRHEPTPFYVDRVFVGRRGAEEWIEDLMRSHTALR